MKSKVEKYWHKIEITNADQFSELISSFLVDLGSVGLQETENQLLVYFHGASNVKSIQTKLKQYLNQLTNELKVETEFKISISQIETENWQQNWMQYFKPIFVEDKLVITPSWENVSFEKGKIIITIDPEQAFGTGGHATTYLMLKLLLNYCKPGMQILDVGTGSGVLAIAAAKLGSEKIVAFDIDPVAVKTAKQNSEINNVSSQITCFSGDIFALRPGQTQVDFILANISSGVLRNLLPRFPLFLKNSNSLLALSGIMSEEANSISNLLKEYQFIILDFQEKDEWVSFLCQQNQI
jgi:ribosomal protein L11 methyltransferase